MQRYEYKILEIQVNRVLTPKVPENLGVKVDELAADGWVLDRAVPIQSAYFLPLFGSKTESLLLFFRRECAETGA